MFRVAKFLSIITTLLVTGIAMAGSAHLSVTGVPATMQPGQSAAITITLSANGKYNDPVNVVVAKDYSLSGALADSSTATFHIEADQYSGGVVKGTTPGSFSVPENAVAGTYTVNLKGVEVGSPGNVSGSFEVQIVVPENPIAPVVTIDSPANGSTFTVGQPISICVTVDENGYELNGDGVTASLDGGSTFSLAYNADLECYTGSVTTYVAGAHELSVSATNAGGTGTATTTFTCVWKFDGFLPPVTTAKFNAGRTLPIKFQISDFAGTTGSAEAEVLINGVSQGLASAILDEAGNWYYQLNYTIPKTSGNFVITVKLNDGSSHSSNTIVVK